MNIHILGAHNSESLNSRFVCLLIDDVLAIDAGGLTSGLSWPAQQKLRAILLTHQHYDHIRDIPAIAINRFFRESTIDIYSTRFVHDALSSHLLNGLLYPNFMEIPEAKPAVRFTVIEPYKTEQIEGYQVLPVTVNHSRLTVGYQVVSPDNKTVFYTADTGAGLTACWEYISPQLLIIETTLPDRYQEFATQSGHLTPTMLGRELTDFRQLKDYLPEVVVVHMDPELETEIAAEIAVVARELNIPINLAYEGMQIEF